MLLVRYAAQTVRESRLHRTSRLYRPSPHMERHLHACHVINHPKTLVSVVVLDAVQSILMSECITSSATCCITCNLDLSLFIRLENPIQLCLRIGSFGRAAVFERSVPRPILLPISKWKILFSIMFICGGVSVAVCNASLSMLQSEPQGVGRQLRRLLRAFCRPRSKSFVQVHLFKSLSKPPFEIPQNYSSPFHFTAPCFLHQTSSRLLPSL
jgi:hypothetical protein